MLTQEISKLTAFLVVFGIGIVFGFVLRSQVAMAPDNSVIENVAEESDIEEKEYEAPEGWITYRDVDAGVQFDYPAGTERRYILPNGSLTGSAQSSISFSSISIPDDVVLDESLNEYDHAFRWGGIQPLDKLGYSLEEYLAQNNILKSSIKEYDQFGIPFRYLEYVSPFMFEGLEVPDDISNIEEGCAEYLFYVDRWYRFSMHECGAWGQWHKVAASIRPLDTK